MTIPLPPLKRFGQNFLVDQNIIAKIFAVVNLKGREHVLEIGPGRGGLTQGLAQRAARVVAIEIDRGLCRHLETFLKDAGNVDVLCRDILKFGLRSYAAKHRIKRFMVVANLPYYITTPIIEYLFKNASLIDDIFIMVQREVAERMTAPAGSEAYGSLSCFVNYFCAPRVLFKIKGTSFSPAPDVESCFIRLTPYKEPLKHHGVRSQEVLFQAIRASFGQRRKKISGPLARVFGKETVLKLSGSVLLERRPEELGLADFVGLSNQIFDISSRR